MFKEIAILMYHSIEPENSPRLYENEKFYNITPEKFREQMHYLKKNGYNTINLSELKIMFSKNDEGLPPKPVMLTFDDGHISNYDRVLPILEEFGFRGVFFLVINDIGKEYRLNWEQVKALKNSGMDIGSHGMNHKILSRFSQLALIRELKSSKEILEENLKTEILAFSVPRGLYSKKISNVAREMGWELVLTSLAGTVSLRSDPYCLRRFVMLGHYSMREFISIIQKEPIFMIKKYLERFVKDGVQEIIGIKGYEEIKKAVFLRCRRLKEGDNG